MQSPPEQPSPIAWQTLFFKVLLLGSVAALVLWLIIRLSIVTAPILIGFFIAYALNPIVVRLRRWRVPPILALTVPVLAVLALAVVFIIVVLPNMARELVYASQHAPARIYNFILKLDPWFLSRTGNRLSSLIHYDSLSGMMQRVAAEMFGPAQTLIGWLLSSVRDVFVAIGNFALVLIVAFFLLDDYEKIVKGGADLIPRGDLARVTRVVKRIDSVLAGFLRGELLLLLAAVVCFTLGIVLLEVPFAFVIGPMVAVLYLIPYVGVVSGLVLCVVLSALAGHSALTSAGIAGLFMGFYVTDLLFITPRIIGNRVGLRPLVVLLGIVAFGELFGLIGILIAIPILATGRILLLEAVEQYRQSAAYRGEHAGAPSLPPELGD